MEQKGFTIYQAGQKLCTVRSVDALLNMLSALQRQGFKNLTTNAFGKYALLKPHGKAVNRLFNTHWSASGVGIDLYEQRNYTVQYIDN